METPMSSRWDARDPNSRPRPFKKRREERELEPQRAPVYWGWRNESNTSGMYWSVSQKTFGTQICDGIPFHVNWSLPPVCPTYYPRFPRELLGPPNREITKQELAAYYQVLPRTVDRWRSRRWISYKKIGQTLRFDLALVKSELNMRFQRRAGSLV